MLQLDFWKFLREATKPSPPAPTNLRSVPALGRGEIFKKVLFHLEVPNLETMMSTLKYFGVLAVAAVVATIGLMAYSATPTSTRKENARDRKQGQ